MDTPNKLCKSSRSLMVLVLSVGFFLFCLKGCFGKQPIRVGFVAQLTDVQAELSVQERNGVRLAVEEINAKDAIGGRPLELVVRDDLGTPAGARAADRDLIERGSWPSSDTPPVGRQLPDWP